MSRFQEARARIGGLKGLMRKLGKAPESERWKDFKCPFCGHKSASVHPRGGVDYFKCFHPDCGMNRAVTETGFIALAEGLDDSSPPPEIVTGRDGKKHEFRRISPACRRFYELAGLNFEEKSTFSNRPQFPRPADGSAAVVKPGFTTEAPGAADPLPEPPPLDGGDLPHDDLGGYLPTAEELGAVFPEGEIPNPAPNPTAEDSPAVPPSNSEHFPPDDPEVVRNGQPNGSESAGTSTDGQRVCPPDRPIDVGSPTTNLGKATDGPVDAVPSSPAVEAAASVATEGHGARTSPTPSTAGASLSTDPTFPPPPPTPPSTHSAPRNDPDDRREGTTAELAAQALAWFWANTTWSEDDARRTFEKRGLVTNLWPFTCRLLGFRSNTPANLDVLIRAADVFPVEALVRSGLWRRTGTDEPGLEMDDKGVDGSGPAVPASHGAKPNPQFYGNGIVGPLSSLLEEGWVRKGKRTVVHPVDGREGFVASTDGEEDEDAMVWANWVHPVLIPYLPVTHAAAETNTETQVKVAMITEGEFKAAAVWQVFATQEAVPFKTPEEAEEKARQRFSSIAAIRPHKGGAKNLPSRFYHTPMASKSVMAGALPGVQQIHPNRGGWLVWPGILGWLEQARPIRTVVVYDNEDRSSPTLADGTPHKRYQPNPMKRNHADAWAIVLGERITKKGWPASVGRLPDEWRDPKSLKADWDGGLADRLKAEARSRPNEGMAEAWERCGGDIRRDWWGVLSAAVPIGELEGTDFEQWWISKNVKKFGYQPQLPVFSKLDAQVGSRLFRLVNDFDEANDANARTGGVAPVRMSQPAVQYLRSVARAWSTWSLEMVGAYLKLDGAPKAAENPNTKIDSADPRCRENWVRWRMEAVARGDLEAVWACDVAMVGKPATVRPTDNGGKPGWVSNFHIVPFWPIRRAQTRELERLVEIRNIHGFESGLQRIDPIAQSTATELRRWLQRWAHVSWNAGQNELDWLNGDLAAYFSWATEVQEVVQFGWHPNSQGWVFGDCMFVTEKSSGVVSMVKPDRNRVFWAGQKGYRMQELAMADGSQRAVDMAGDSFVHGAPMMRPDVKATDAEVSKLFEVFCERMAATIGSDEALLLIGQTLAYGAAPEVYAQQSCFSGVWLHGEKGSGKSTIAQMLLAMWGYMLDGGVKLGSTVPGLEKVLNQSSNLPVYLEEFQIDCPENVVQTIKNAYNREKRAKAGDVREIATAPVIVGEHTTRDSGLKSRYLEVLVASARRKGTDAEKRTNYEWLRDNRHRMFLLGRHVLLHRKEYAAEVMRRFHEIVTSPEMLRMSEQRTAVLYSVALAGFEAFCTLVKLPVLPLRATVVALATQQSAEVQQQVKLEMWWDQIIACFKAGAFGQRRNEIRRYFSFKDCGTGMAPGVPAGSKQTAWTSYLLYIEPKGLFQVLREEASRGREIVPLSPSDARQQMSARPYWKPMKRDSRVRFAGPDGTGSISQAAWCIDLNAFEGLGYTPATDEEMEEARYRKAQHGEYAHCISCEQATASEACCENPSRFVSVEGTKAYVDPRKGALYAIIESLIEPKVEDGD